VVGFQNCASEAPFGSTTQLDSLVQGSTFPYHADFDQVAYMSCSEQGDVFPDPQTFFTFRVGAYRTGGLGLSDEFIEATERVNERTVRNVLLQNELSVGSRLRFALRPNENFLNIYRNADSSELGEEGTDFSSALTNMGEISLVDQIMGMAPGQKLLTWDNAPFESQIRLEGSLYFDSSELLQNDMRNQITRGMLLALTFNEEESGQPRGPSSREETASTDLRRDVFGSAVQIRFRQPFPGDFENVAGSRFASTAPSTDTPPRLLGSVQEVSIGSNSDPATFPPWTCPDSLAFRIVLPQHAVAQGCQIQPDPAIPSQDLTAIRQSLYVEDWYIDTINRCAIPREDRIRTGSCYGIDSDTDDTRIIQYDFSQPCGLDDNKGACAHFVSICVREQ